MIDIPNTTSCPILPNSSLYLLMYCLGVSLVVSLSHNNSLVELEYGRLSWGISIAASYWAKNETNK